MTIAESLCDVTSFEISASLVVKSIVIVRGAHCVGEDVASVVTTVLSAHQDYGAIKILAVLNVSRMPIAKGAQSATLFVERV